MVISRTPLRVMSFNQYDEVLDSDLKGCSFTVEPESIGYVDDDAIFHATEVAGSGKIIARYADFSAELAVNTIGVTEVKAELALMSALLPGLHRLKVLLTLHQTVLSPVYRKAKPLSPEALET